MTTMTFLPMLLADANRMRNLGSHFRGESSAYTWQDGVMPVVVFTVVGLLLWLAFRLSRQGERRTTNNPQALFRDLCRAHRLDARSKRLLQDLAHEHALAHPALVFVQPELFQPDQLAPHQQSRASELSLLAERLFDRE